MQDNLTEGLQREWNRFDVDFVSPYEDNRYVIRLKSLLQGEHSHTKNLFGHGNVRLLGFYARRKTRERLLGYVLHYVGSPVVHAYTWYVSISYSPVEEVKRRPMKVLYSDKKIRLLRAGIGVKINDIETFDYLLCYRSRNTEHDSIGNSDGSLGRFRQQQWKDGL